MNDRKELIRVLDNFCPAIEQVRQSALDSGFSNWSPKTSAMGRPQYEGMNFCGRHSYMMAALVAAVKELVFPNTMFFRVTNSNTEEGYVHSDRHWGAHTCVVYLSDHPEVSGTAFYRNRATGLMEMPTHQQMLSPEFEQLKQDVQTGGENEWEQIDFVRGLYNRAVIFHAPLFHGRFPKHGIGESSEEGRMVWVCHFHTGATLNQQ